MPIVKPIRAKIRGRRFGSNLIEIEYITPIYSKRYQTYFSSVIVNGQHRGLFTEAESSRILLKGEVVEKEIKIPEYEVEFYGLEVREDEQASGF